MQGVTNLMMMMAGPPKVVGSYLEAWVGPEKGMDEQVAGIRIRAGATRSWREDLEGRMGFDLPHKD